SGSVVFGGGTQNTVTTLNSNVTLTLGPSLTVDGKTGTFRTSTATNPGHLVNQGTLQADVSGGTISIDPLITDLTHTGTLAALNGGNLSVAPGSWTNAGVLSIGGGGTLSLGGSWTNTGSVTETGSTLNLGGSFTQARLGSFTRTGGTVNLTGTLSGGLTLNDT